MAIRFLPSARADLQRRIAALEAQSAVDAEQTAAQFHSAQTSFAAQVWLHGRSDGEAIIATDQ